MRDARDPHPDSRPGFQDNAAWRAAHAWRQRARHSGSGGLLGGLKLLAAWLLFGLLMIVAVVLGLFFLLLGWALMPLLRRRLRKRMEQMRADQAEDIGGPAQYRETHYRETVYRRAPRSESRSDSEVLEGDYEVKDAPRQDDPPR